MVQQVGADRLGEMGISTVQQIFDEKNAFGAISSGLVRGVARELVPGDGCCRALAEPRVSSSYFAISDGDRVVFFDTRLVCGDPVCGFRFPPCVQSVS